MFEVDENVTEEEKEKAVRQGKKVGKIGELDIEALEQARSEGKIIGLVQGSWDQFHIGHQRYIKKAKEKCDYLIVGVDSDEKIRKRKGPNRPLIPENERYEMIKELGVGHVGKYEPGKSVADDIVIKPVDEEKWGLIKRVRPDVLIAIPENYSIEDVDKLVNECGVGSVAFFGRQAETSTSNKLRQKLIANMADKVDSYEEKLKGAIETTKERLAIDSESPEPLQQMMEHLADSTDWVTPVVAAANIQGKWFFGTNQCDYSLSKDDLNNRTELFYSTVEHAEINLLKRIGSQKDVTDTIYCSLFPCDKCMKTLIDKGIKTIYYLEDHPEKNWSKRSHDLADRKGIKTICLKEEEKEEVPVEQVDYTGYKYIYPPNVRHQEQLDIMINSEQHGIDPIAPEVLTNEVMFVTEWWHVSKNKFPYQDENGIPAENHILLVSRKEIYSIPDMPREMWDDLNDIWNRLISEYNLDGGALCFRFGDCSKSGASQKRVHAHIIEPQPESKLRFPIGGNKCLRKNLEIKNFIDEK